MNIALLLLIQSYAIQYGVDPNLAIAIAQVESKFDTKAIGSKGELGLYQLLPSAHPFIAPSRLLDVKTNIRLGVAHLAWSKQHCSHSEGNTWIICYNLGVTGAKRIRHPKLFSYYKRVMEVYESKRI